MLGAPLGPSGTRAGDRVLVAAVDSPRMIAWTSARARPFAAGPVAAGPLGAGRLPLCACLALAGCVPADGDGSADVGPGVATLPDSSDSGEGSAADSVPLRLNELMAKNDSTAEDEHGREPDWVELVNLGDETIPLAGFGLATDPQGPRWPFPDAASIAPGEHRLVWLDERPELGPMHADLRLDADGGTLLLVHSEALGDVLVDQLDFPGLPADVAWGRFPDGGPFTSSTILATPGNANPQDPGLSADPSELLFPTDRVLRLDLSMPAASYDALASDAYTYAEGAVSFGGVTLSPVGIRIKGQYGSLRGLDDKAALKVSMDAFGGSARLRGLENLTLNNMVQDGSLVHETLAYAQFRDAGVPAPRTAHVALYLDGEYRGLYLHVETADETFLARWYEDPEGNLYEGEYGEDLTLDSYLELEQDERGSSDPDDYSDLAAVAALLALSPDEALVPELETLVDVDEVVAMWAVEVIIGHWDGYFWYPNNYRVFHDPSSGRISLLPWGVDQTYDYDGDHLEPRGALAAWCLEIPSVRARYLRALWRAAERMEALPLDTLAADTHARVLPWFDADPYKETSAASSELELYVTEAFLAERPGVILDRLFPDGPPE